MNFMSAIEIYGGQAYEEHATQKHPLGTLGYTRDGRTFRYVKAGAALLVTGNLVQGPAPIANHLALTPTAASALGSQVITATLGATAAAENDYAEGWAQIDTTPGNGYGYPVSGHAAVLLSGIITVNLPSDAAIQVALTTSSRVGLHKNPYKGVIQTPTTITGKVAGVVVQPLNLATFGWIQTRGPAPVLINGTPAVTAPVINGATTAGSVDVWTAAAQPTATYIGEMMQVGVSGKNNMVFLKID